MVQDVALDEEEAIQELVMHLALLEAVIFVHGLAFCVGLVLVVAVLVATRVVIVLVRVDHPVAEAMTVLVQCPFLAVLVHILPTASAARPNND